MIEQQPISIVTAQSLPERGMPRLDCLADEMNRDGALLQVDPRRLEESLSQGLAAVIMTEIGGREVPIAISRLIPLISPNLANRLRLPEELRGVYELGSVFVRAEHRNHGLGRTVQEATLRASATALENEEALVIGTTKEMRELRAVGHIAGMRGVAFEPVHHLEFPFIAPLTCVCKPTESPFGTGFQYGGGCHQRVQKEQVPDIVVRSRIPRKNEVNMYQDTHIACTMFISSRKAAEKFNEGYQQFFGHQQRMVQQLVEVGYYE